MKLIPYNEITEQAYMEYIAEWEATDALIVPFASRRNSSGFEDLQCRWRSDTTDEPLARGFVPATLYFMVDETGYIYGAIHLRHYLNAFLLHEGGHIGYGIRPSQRRKGYAVQMLQLMLLEANKRGLDKVMITCNDDNLGSSKTIEHNGGTVYELTEIDNHQVRKYWLPTKKE